MTLLSICQYSASAYLKRFYIQYAFLIFCFTLQVILRKDGKIKLLCKGADSIVYKRLDSSSRDLMEVTTHHLNVRSVVLWNICFCLHFPASTDARSRINSYNRTCFTFNMYIKFLARANCWQQMSVTIRLGQVR